MCEGCAQNLPIGLVHFMGTTGIHFSQKLYAFIEHFKSEWHTGAKWFFFAVTGNTSFKSWRLAIVECSNRVYSQSVWLHSRTGLHDRKIWTIWHNNLSRTSASHAGVWCLRVDLNATTDYTHPSRSHIARLSEPTKAGDGVPHQVDGNYASEFEQDCTTVVYSDPEADGLYDRVFE